jgi:hypothetical protein
VRADDQRVRTQLERVPGQVGMEAEVRRPRRVDDQRDVVGVGRLREPGHVADRAEVRRVTDEHGSRVGVPREGLGDGRRGDAEGQPGVGVDLGSHPDRLEPGQHQTEQHRAVQGPADDHAVALAAEREGDGLVGVRGPAGGEPADVGPPQPGGPGLRLDEHSAGQLHGVQAGVQRDVAGDHVADQVVPLLVARDRERRRGLFVEAQPGVEQRCVTAELARVGRHPRHASPGTASAGSDAQPRAQRRGELARVPDPPREGQGRAVGTDPVDPHQLDGARGQHVHLDGDHVLRCGTGPGGQRVPQLLLVAVGGVLGGRLEEPGVQQVLRRPGWFVPSVTGAGPS